MYFKSLSVYCTVYLYYTVVLSLHCSKPVMVLYTYVRTIPIRLIRFLPGQLSWKTIVYINSDICLPEVCKEERVNRMGCIVYHIYVFNTMTVLQNCKPASVTTNKNDLYSQYPYPKTTS